MGKISIVFPDFSAEEAAPVEERPEILKACPDGPVPKARAKSYLNRFKCIVQEFVTIAKIGNVAKKVPPKAVNLN